MTLVDADQTGAARPVLSRAGGVVRWVALGVVVVLLWPLALGGLFGGIIVTGHSMEPNLLPGDLAIIARVGEAQVGDVVVFQPDVAPQARVIHRVIAAEGEHLRLKGDNNDWTDPFDVVQDDVVGKLVLRLPQVGEALSFLADVRVWASLLLLGAGWWLWPRRAQCGPR